MRQNGDAYLITPAGFSIPPEATKIHHITTSRASEDGAPLHEVLQRFKTVLGQYRFLVAHNMAFDEPVVMAEFYRTKIKMNLNKHVRLCTKNLSTDYCAIPGANGYKWPTLSELHRHLFGVDYQEAHDARADIEACARCFFELRRLKVIE